MAKAECPSMKTKGLLVLVVGLLYLLQDYGVALGWWKVSWYTALFVLMGLCYCCKSMK